MNNQLKCIFKAIILSIASVSIGILIAKVLIYTPDEIRTHICYGLLIALSTLVIWILLQNQSTKTIGQALADTPTVKAVSTEAINNLINDIEVLRTDPVIIDNDDVQRFAENVLYALNNLIKEGK